MTGVRGSNPVHSAKSKRACRFLAGPLSWGFAGAASQSTPCANISPETTGPQRLTLGLVTGLVVAALPLPLGWQFCGLLGWCAGVGVYLGLAWWLCVRFDAKRTRERAQAQDEPSVVLFLLMLLATMACVAAITLMMQQAKNLSGMERTLHIVLAVAALAASWLFMQTIYAFRYAHRYYHEEKLNEPGRSPA